MKAVIFDLDGTLIDTEKYFKVFWPMAAGKFGLEMSEEQALSLRSLGKPFAAEIFKKWYGDGADYVKIRQCRRELMEEFFQSHPIEAKSGAGEVLSGLKKMGYIVAVATATSPEKTRKTLGDLGLLDFFDEIVSTTMVERGKPAPDVYLCVCEKLGLEPGECYAVEDSPNGVMAAYNAGLKVIMVPDQTLPDDELRQCLYKCVGNLTEIIDVVGQQA